MELTLEDFESKIAELTSMFEGQIRDLLNKIEQVEQKIPDGEYALKEVMEAELDKINTSISNMSTDVAELKVQMDEIVNIEVPEFLEE